MGFRWKFFLYYAVIFIFNLGVLQCLNLQLYQRKNFVGLQLEYSLQAEDEKLCMNFASGGYNVRSVKTDKCVILYVNRHCTTPKTVVAIGLFSPGEWSHRIDKHTAHIPAHNKSRRFPYSSFHVCSQDHGGGPQLDMDFYNHPHPGNSRIAEYRGVCNCRNIGDIVNENPNMYVDMHGNMVAMFSEENCQGNSYILGPHDSLYNRFPRNTIQFIPKSFHPVGLHNCYRLHADIYKFDLREENIEIRENTSEIIKMDDEPTVLYNYGPTETLQNFGLSSTNPDLVLFLIAEPITKLQSAEVNPGFELSAEAKLWMINNASIKAQLGKYYKWNRRHASNPNNIFGITTIKRLAKSSIQIDVPPCSYCKITPTYESVINLPILYDLYAYIRGSDHADRLTAAQIRDNLPPGMTYIRDHDKHTVMVKTNGTMFGSLAIDVVIDSKCHPTPFCARADYIPSVSSKDEYRKPISLFQGNVG